MSDVIEKTPAGATRALFGALGFILLMLGLEGMTGAAAIQFGLGLFLVLLGVVCFYGAFFWETAKNALSVEAQTAISSFAKSNITWSIVLLLVFQTLILSRFVEQHRWPFSYQADPRIYAENERLKQQDEQTKLDAAKYRFAYDLKIAGPKAANGERITCDFSLSLSSGPMARNAWGALAPLLDMAGWQNVSNGASNRSRSTVQRHNNFKRKCREIFRLCDGIRQGVRRGVRTRTRFATNNQISPILDSCKNECVELDVGN